MRNTMLIFCLCFVLAMTACNKQPQMKQQNVQDATRKMAGSESVQRSFSDGRLRVMSGDERAKHFLLQNTMKEQQMIANDPALRNRSIQIQNQTRDKALQNPELKNLLLKQNLQEQEAILKDPDLRGRMLAQYIQTFRVITSTPSLRSEMADALIPLLKDPKIAKEMENMMKLMMAKEMKKMTAMMQMMQKKQMQQMQKMKQMQQTQKMKQLQKKPQPQPPKKAPPEPGERL